jgi:hypothetical protein
MLHLAAGQRVRVTLLGARSNWCDGDLLLLTPAVSSTPVPGDGLPPGARRLWASYLRHFGEAVVLGPYPAETDLVLGLAPSTQCAPPDSTAANGAVGSVRPSTGPNARIAHSEPAVWDIWWEDYRPDATADFDDLVVRVEVLPATPAAPGGH